VNWLHFALHFSLRKRLSHCLLHRLLIHLVLGSLWQDFWKFILMKLSPFSTVFYSLRRKLFLQNAWANCKLFSIHMWLVINKKHCRNSKVWYEIAHNNSYSASRLRQYSKRRKNSTFCIYTLVKENKKATFFYGIVSVLSVAPTVDGTLWLTFATSWRSILFYKAVF